MIDSEKKSIYSFLIRLIHPSEDIIDCPDHKNHKFWDNLVRYASCHLILPAVYGGVKRKNIENHLPKKLLAYLEKISKINFKQNSLILEQVKFLHKILSKNNIDYVFLKGTALLIDNSYDAINERMLGDIDILVSEKDLLKCQLIFKKNGYKEISDEVGFSEKLLMQKHLRRLVHEDYISAVELHRRVLVNLKNPLLNPIEILKNKQKSNDGYFIPSKLHIWKHAIYNWQLNDKGYISNYISIRSIIDVFHYEPKRLILEIKSYDNYIKHFYNLISVHMHSYYSTTSLSMILYDFQLRSSTFFRLMQFLSRIMSFFRLIFSRILLLLKSNIYRNKILDNPRKTLKKIIDNLKN
tara:strand:- start:3669 stop:4727 length:1059 start_codon:yes stop_codon:yes gene_type:complete